MYHLKKRISKAVLIFCLLAALVPDHQVNASSPPKSSNRNSVVFFHPDGMSLSHWTAIRMITVGPDGMTNWDGLPGMAIYRGHMRDALSATSNGGATSHAYGVKVGAGSFGMDDKQKIRSASGFDGSLMLEAKRAGKAIGLVQTGYIAEPGTAAFLARIEDRSRYEEIAKQVVMAEPDVHFSGGERFLLPKGAKGRFGEGERSDGLNLIEWAQEKGYTVVYTKEELKGLPNSTKKVLGVFSWSHTFNDETEEELKKKELPLYNPQAPTVGEMAEAALKVLSRHSKGFFLVVEEEGTDNFANKNNASGFLEAGQRSDKAVGLLNEFVKKSPRTLLLVTSDSDASGLQVLGLNAKIMPKDKPLPAGVKECAICDGQEGTASLPFLAAPDKAGVRLPFAIAWTGTADGTGGILVRAAGKNSGKVRGHFDNTEIYKLMRETLFK